MDKAQKQLVNTYIRKRELATGESSYGYGQYSDDMNIRPYELLYLIKNGIVNEDKIEGYNISDLILMNKKLYYDPDVKPFLNKITGGGIAQIIIKYPEFVNIFDFENLNPTSASVVLEEKPELINRYDINKMKESELLEILAKQPQLITDDRFENALKNANSLRQTMFHSNLVGYSINDEDKRKKQWDKYIDALAKYPQYRQIFNDKLKKMSGYEITAILKKNPDLVNEFNYGENLDYGLDRLLITFPELINKIDKNMLNALDDYDISRIIKYAPQLAPYFKGDSNG